MPACGRKGHRSPSLEQAHRPRLFLSSRGPLGKTQALVFAAELERNFVPQSPWQTGFIHLSLQHGLSTACEMGFWTLPTWSALRPFDQSFLFFPSILSLKADIITCLLNPTTFFCYQQISGGRQKQSCIFWDSKGSSQLPWIFTNIFLELILLALKNTLVHCSHLS